MRNKSGERATGALKGQAVKMLLLANIHGASWRYYRSLRQAHRSYPWANYLGEAEYLFAKQQHHGTARTYRG